VVEYLVNMELCTDAWKVTLLHVFRKPAASEELMGKKFTKEQRPKFLRVLEKAKERLIEKGFSADHVEVQLVTDPYPTVADGIIAQFKNGEFDMVVIGRKKMSKAEEFVVGDVSVKLVRALEGTAILVVKPQ
jgi:nucleotide-binding universal stress UspA family protein